MKNTDRQTWVDHIFDLNIPVGWTSNVMTRIEDTVIRLQHHASPLSEEALSRQLNQKWSIKEHIGHLTTLEEVHLQRLKEMKALLPELTMADMSNKKTHTANYNSFPLEVLINDFKKERHAFIHEFNQLSEQVQSHQSIHPRLKVPMKPVDMLFFIAEHDDHHIASILSIKKSIV